MIEGIIGGIIARYATKGIDFVVGKLNIHGISPNALRDIQAAHEETLNKWSKNQGAKDSASLKINQLIKDNYSAVLNNENLPKELKQYLNYFKETISLKKYENAYRYLTNKQNEEYFKTIILKIDVLSEIILTKQDYNDGVESILQAQQRQTVEIKELLSEKSPINDINKESKFKDDIFEYSEFFLPKAEFAYNFDHFVLRHLRKETDLEGNQNQTRLNDLVRYKSENFILIKGQPGMGKSIELQKLAYDLWSDRDTDLIPFYRNLRDFTNTDNISDFFCLNELNQYVNVVFILDGLDEIKHEEDFLSKFKTHLNNRKNNNHRYVLSCRSNILESFRSDLNNFEIYELQELSLRDAQCLLKKKTGRLFSTKELYDFQIKSSFINDPFKLNMVGEFYNENRRLETNPILLWDNYIQIITKRDKRHKQRKKEPKYFKLISDSQLISFLMECTKSSQISDDELIKVLSESEVRFQEFINSAIVLAKENYYSFEHKQLQEYLAAKFISSYKTETIIEIFKIKSLDSIHPNLENVFALLINLLNPEDKKLEKILQWIENVKPDMLFKGDTDRIKKFKIPIFQDFFKKECEKTTLWIGNTTSVSVEEIARFADCPENLNFLLSYLKDEEQHFRVRISALNLLEYFKPLKSDDLKNELFKILNNPDAKINLKANVVELIEKWKFIDDYPNIIYDVIDIFKNEHHSEIGSRVLSLIETHINNIDRYFDYIKKEFDFSFGGKKRLNDDEVRRGNDWKVENLMLELNDKDNFLELLTEYFKKNHFKHHYPEYKEEKIIEALRRFKKRDSDIIFDLVKPIVTDNHFNPSYKEDFIVKIINEFDENFKLFKWLFKTQDFSKCKWLMSRIANEKCIKHYIDNWINILGVSNSDLEGFRNIVSNYHQKKNWHLKIEDSYRDANIEIKQSLKGMVPIEERIKQCKIQVQKDLDLLFNQKSLLSEVEKVFNKINKENISHLDLHATFSMKENSDDSFLRFFGYRGIGYELISSVLVQNDNEVSFSDCKEYVSNPESFIFFIKSEVKSTVDNDRIDLDISFLDKDLSKYILNLIKGLKVTDILEYVNRSKFEIKNGEFKNYKNFHIIQTIHELLLIQGLALQIPDDFLINTLEYFDIKSFDENQSKFEKYLSKINEKDAVHSKIIENLSKPLFSSVYMKHAFYALESDLNESFDYIKKYLLESNEIRSELSLLNKYIDKSGPEILLEMMSEIDTMVCWRAIEISMKREVYKKECVTKAKKYIGKNDDKFEKDAAKVLFKTNQPEIISYINEDLKGRIHIIRVVHTSYIKDYNILPNDDIDFVERLFNVIYNDYEKDRFEKAALNEFFRNYIINIAIQKDNYKKLNNKLQEIKVSPTTLESDNRRFFINLIIDECEKAYINEMSKPMSFKEALKLVKETEI